MLPISQTIDDGGEIWLNYDILTHISVNCKQPSSRSLISYHIDGLSIPPYHVEVSLLDERSLYFTAYTTYTVNIAISSFFLQSISLSLAMGSISARNNDRWMIMRSEWGFIVRELSSFRVQGFILHHSLEEKEKALATYFREQCDCTRGEEIEKGCPDWKWVRIDLSAVVALKFFLDPGLCDARTEDKHDMSWSDLPNGDAEEPISDR